jgi:predicted transcriptional regulator
MTPTTKANFIKWAIAYKAKNFQRSPDEVLTQSQQLAIAIYDEIPTDGKFIKASEIAEILNRKSRQVNEILGLIKEPWDLKSSTNNQNGGYTRNEC